MSDGGSFTADAKRFNRSLISFATYSTKSNKTVLLEVSRNFVRRVIAITPPSQGKSNSESKKRGETAIAADLRRIMMPGPQDFIDRFIDFNNGRDAKYLFGHKGAAALGFVYTRALTKGELDDWHNSRRRKDGRVMRVNSRVTTGLKKRDLRGLDQGLVETRTYNWFRRKVQKRVGALAAGWNRAAASLGYRPPAWIRRHGEANGSVSINIEGGILRVLISNDVKYAGNVKDLKRRVQTALNQQSEALERRVAFYLKKNGKGAGFK